MNMNYYDTFITVSPDCPAEFGVVPPEKKEGKTRPRIEFELAAQHPYKYTQEQLLYEVHIQHKDIPQEEIAAKGTQLWDEFFSKSMACMRASMLPKKYGWGVHFNKEGKLALIPVESEEYGQLQQRGENGEVKVLAAMRNSKKKK